MDVRSVYRTSPFEQALALLAGKGVHAKVIDHLRERWTDALADKTPEDAARLLMRAILLTCPRCAGLMPSEEQMGDYAGAISRSEAGAEVCSHCGDEEAEIWASAPWAGKDRVQAMLEDRASWALPEVAHPHPDRASRSSR